MVQEEGNDEPDIALQFDHGCTIQRQVKGQIKHPFGGLQQRFHRIHAKQESLFLVVVVQPFSETGVAHFDLFCHAQAVFLTKKYKTETSDRFSTETQFSAVFRRVLVFAKTTF